ncbi:MAG TPA: hypothetical protein VNZ67_00640 [bacterium]|nr:hypothetical protein [bacterium]
MSRAKGLEAPSWVARYLRAWFPEAVKTPNSLKGRDIENTPGIAFEVKTSPHWRHKAIDQAAGYADGRGELALVVYLPPGLGEAQVANALVVLPLWAVMPLAVAAGFAPEPRPRPVGDLSHGAGQSSPGHRQEE